MRDVTAKYATNLAAALERRQLSEAQVARCSAGAARWRFKSAAPFVSHGNAGCPPQPPRRTGCRTAHADVPAGGPRARRVTCAHARADG